MLRFILSCSRNAEQNRWPWDTVRDSFITRWLGDMMLAYRRLPRGGSFFLVLLGFAMSATVGYLSQSSSDTNFFFFLHLLASQYRYLDLYLSRNPAATQLTPLALLLVLGMAAIL